MAEDKAKATKCKISRLIQRQLMLLDFQEQENEWGLRTWPTVPGISLHKSRRLFEMLERWGWIAGSPFPPDSYKCIVTSQGVERLARIKSGQPLMDGTDLDIIDGDRQILCGDSGKTLPDKIKSWICQLPSSRPCMWVILCLGIVLIMVGTHLSIPDGPMFKSWGTLLVTLGAIFAVGILRWWFRSVQQRYTALSWLPVGVALFLFIPIAWLLFNDMVQPWVATCLLAAVGIAGIPRAGLIRTPLFGSAG